jgi:ubiquinone/menaquinone biosynthesis C-methylase UbiE
MDYDKTDIPQTYNRGRDHGPVFLQQWMDAVAGHVDTESVSNVVDLGCGTGRFSQGLARRLNADVVGIDPSIKMLQQARANLDRSKVWYACGLAEAIPLRDDSVDMIFISMIFHHLKDPQLAAQECARVLRKNGRLLLRTASSEKIPTYPYVPFFPTSRAVLERRLPSLRFQCDVFEAAFFKVLFSGVVTQQIAENYSTYADKLSTRSDSVLISLDEKDFEEGLAALRAAKPAGPIVEQIDFVVFGK